MAEKNKNIKPCVAVPPGVGIAEELKARKITQREFAGKIGMSPSHFNELIKGKITLTSNIALKLEKELGIDAYIWLNLQSKYDCDMLRLKNAEKKTKRASKENVFNVLLKKKGITYSEFLMIVKNKFVSENINVLSPSERKQYNLV